MNIGIQFLYSSIHEWNYMYFFICSVCLGAHIVSHRGVPAGIAVCLTRECLQASTGVNGFIFILSMSTSHLTPQYCFPSYLICKQ